ncbi:MerR family transcriptional regulator [Heyndrickxia oleronia]|uniref:MerR family transcriptional regulator n=1 Tax=Heyndrickxia oleronia TaxID=38875 RepID=UPI002040AE38|nr:MerR family transcriptional regulator [Heyndrickxia oleronia]MCM3240540.1 MerR family transcriptional regulator [Heyndrickxia oleronia]
MNTASVAKLLGVSHSTIQRWIKQLELEIHRNDLGHFEFSDEDIAMFKQIQAEIQKGKLLHEINLPFKKVRKGKKTQSDQPTTNTLHEKLIQLEGQINGKADNVVSYQLLSHRREIEDLENEMIKLTNRIEQLEKKLFETQQQSQTDTQPVEFREREKRKGFLKLFNILG